MSAVSTLVTVEHRVDRSTLNRLFSEARTYNNWLPTPVPESLLRELYGLAKFPPTSANTQPMRIVFVTNPDAKARLRGALAPANVDKVMTAPVTAIVAHDLEFHEKLPVLMPHADFRSHFANLAPEARERVAAQGSAMQGAYLILAARALGLDAGPIGGFDRQKVDAEFFANSTWRSHFLVNLGYGDPAGLFRRNPRLDFKEACRIE
jgi:3-hydroxypropanoate dehydrogenase